MNGEENLRVLVVEDNPGDECLIDLLLKSWGKSEVTYIREGDTALNLIDDVESHPRTPTPDLVLLDLNLPGASGFDVLSRLRNSLRMHDTLVAVLSSSDAMSDRRRALASGANCYLVKPSNVTELVSLGKSLRSLVLYGAAHREEMFF